MLGRPLRVAVCACTYLRPQGLARLLDGLGAIEVPDGVAVEVVIVDNDPSRSGAPIVEGARAAFPFRLHYEVETVRGIVAARNAAVAAARETEADAVAFLDDDEWPSPAWLRELVRVAEATGAEVVTGRVEPVFEVEPPAWVRRGRFFDRPRFPDGTRIHYARTSNALVGAAALAAHDPPFVATGPHGSEDTLFFHRAHLEGRPIVWADAAIVYESVPESRVTAAWLVRRQFRYGLTRSAALRTLDGSPWLFVRRTGRGVLTIFQGVGEVGVGIFRRGRRAEVVRGAATAALGAGLVLGLLGVDYDTYRNVHGS